MFAQKRFTGLVNAGLITIVLIGGVFARLWPGHPAAAARGSETQQNRVIRVSSVNGQRGQTVTVNVELVAQGNENALGFSLNFNPSELSFVNVSLGADASAAMLNSNTMQGANGRLGFALALQTNQTFSAGTKRILTLTFNLPSGGVAGVIPISFGNQPVWSEVVAANAEVLEATWTPGAVTATRAVASVSAASFLGNELAAEQIVAAFGVGLATTTQVAASLPLPTEIAGTTVRMRDSQGESRLSPLFFVAPTQVNYQIPPGTAAGAATVTIASGDGAVSIGNVTIAAVAPGLFSANANGQGVAAATALRVKADGAQIFEPVAMFDTTLNRFTPIPIDLGPEGEQVFLILFGTGFRAVSGLPAVTAKIGGADAEVLFAGAQGGFVGLDQSNVRIPR
ncbi:MAG: cohesin domain-containing protein, partial [Blastocatellia bacterium]